MSEYKVRTLYVYVYILVSFSAFLSQTTVSLDDVCSLNNMMVEFACDWLIELGPKKADQTFVGAT